MSDGSDQITLNYPGGELDLGVTRATEGSSGVNVSSLLSTTGLVTMDPGFGNTAACQSAITYIDGDAWRSATC
jgi:citrate synthase